MISEEKQRMRAVMRARRDQIPPPQREYAAHALIPLVLETLAAASLEAPGFVGLYRSFASELSTLPLESALREQGFLPVFPVCFSGAVMEFAHDSQGELCAVLEENPARVFTPGDQELAALSFVEPDAILALLVPLLAFDARGYRLGYGGGYYDRYLLRLKNTPAYGLAFDEQRVPSVPHEPHDMPLTCIISVPTSS